MSDYRTYKKMVASETVNLQKKLIIEENISICILQRTFRFGSTFSVRCCNGFTTGDTMRGTLWNKRELYWIRFLLRIAWHWPSLQMNMCFLNLIQTPLLNIKFMDCIQIHIANGWERGVGGGGMIDGCKELT